MPIHMRTNFTENRLNYAAKVFAKLKVTAWAWHDSIGLKEIVKRMKMDERHFERSSFLSVQFRASDVQTVPKKDVWHQFEK